VSALLEHASIVSASFVDCLGLVYLHLLHSTERILASRVAMPCTLCTRYQVLSSSRLSVASGGQTVTKSLRIEIRRCIVHVFTTSTILACAHELVVHSSGASARSLSASMSTFSLFGDDCHPIEVVLSEVQIVSDLILHVLAVVVVERKLFYFETVFVVYFVSHAAWVDQLPLGLPARLAVIVVRERYFRMTLVW